MWKRGLIGFFIAAATLALTAPIAHYDGRCGAQTWKALVWGPFDAPEDAYFDEFGIVEAWMRGHNGRSCPFLWQRGDLGPLTEVAVLSASPFSHSVWCRYDQSSGCDLLSRSRSLNRRRRISSDGRRYIGWPCIPHTQGIYLTRLGVIRPSPA